MRYIVLLLLLGAVACAGSAEKQQPAVLERHCGFDLERVDFREDVPMLYSAHIVDGDGLRYDRQPDGTIADSLLRYRISTLMTDALHFV
ncbi:MAG: hypothetical protein LBU95_05125, partial [Rikenellaceae bacterium]|nr:hypothetical protein [Rikenellaceae bacterium]